MEIGNVSTENDTQINTFACITDQILLRAIGRIIESAGKKFTYYLVRRAIGSNIDSAENESLTLRVFASLILNLLCCCSLITFYGKWLSFDQMGGALLNPCFFAIDYWVFYPEKCYFCLASF